MINTTIGILLPFAGTALGAAMVFLLRNELSPRLQKLLLGFASGVMMAASVWSLLLPSIDIATEHPEFDAWRWMTPQEVAAKIVPFKREVYARVFAAFADRLAAS